MLIRVVLVGWWWRLSFVPVGSYSWSFAACLMVIEEHGGPAVLKMLPGERYRLARVAQNTRKRAHKLLAELDRIAAESESETRVPCAVPEQGSAIPARALRVVGASLAYGCVAGHQRPRRCARI